MTGKDIKEMFEGLVDDSSTIDDDLAYQLMNFVKDKIELLRDWEFLKKVDTSKTATTSAILLPSDFLSPLWIYIGEDSTPYTEIPFEQARSFQYNSHRFYIDHRNQNYYLLSSDASGTIYFNYLGMTDDITENTSPIWPAKFHKLIPILMAELFYPVDQEEQGLSWDSKWEQVGSSFLGPMILWDENLKARAQENGYDIYDFQGGIKTPEWYPSPSN